MDENKSGKESKPSADRITSLEDKVAYNIFKRLHPKEICYFKTFSKKWNKMLSDPSFNDLYREYSNKNNLKLVSAKLSYETNPETGETIVKSRIMSLVDYVKGTVDYEDFTMDASPMNMLYAPNGNLICFFNDKGFHIFNPTSKRFATLPEMSSNILNVFTRVGFGYDLSKNEYIFVHIFDAGQDDDDDYDIRCEYLTLSEADQGKDLRTSLSWKMLEKPLPFPIQGEGVLIDGLFYFNTSFECDHSPGQVIVAIDLEKGIYKIFGHPEGALYDGNNRVFLADLNGQLCYGQCQDDARRLDLWLLTEPEQIVQWMKWTNLCSFDMRMLHGFGEDDVEEIELLGLRDGELIFQLPDTDKLDYYNVEEETVREGTVDYPEWGHRCLYTQNLSFLNFRSTN